MWANVLQKSLGVVFLFTLFAQAGLVAGKTASLPYCDECKCTVIDVSSTMYMCYKVIKNQLNSSVYFFNRAQVSSIQNKQPFRQRLLDTFICIIT